MQFDLNAGKVFSIPENKELKCLLGRLYYIFFIFHTCQATFIILMMDIECLHSIIFCNFGTADSGHFFEFPSQNIVILNKKLPKMTIVWPNVSNGVLIKSDVLHLPMVNNNIFSETTAGIEKK